VDPRAGLDDVEKILDLPGLELPPSGCPARRYTDYVIPAPVCFVYDRVIVTSRRLC
jgi:hypothetical protein